MSQCKDLKETFPSLPKICFGSFPPQPLVKTRTESVKSSRVAGSFPSDSSRNLVQSYSDVGLDAQPDIKTHVAGNKQDAQTSSQTSAARAGNGADQEFIKSKVPKSTLRPEAKPYVPQNTALGRLGNRGNTPWNPYAVLGSIPRQRHIVDEDDERHWMMAQLLRYTREHVGLLRLAILNFSRAKEVDIWFHRLTMAGKSQVIPWVAEYPRKRSMQRISCFERHMHSTFHTAPAIDGNPEFVTPFRNAYYFGRDALNSYIYPSKNPELHFITLRKRLESFQGTLLKPVIRTDQVRKLFFWPIIIAGAKQWYFEEAAIFQSYMKLLRLQPYKYEPGTLATDAEVDEEISFENLAQARGQEMKAFALILQCEDQSEKMGRWMIHDRQIGDYHSFNLEIENVVCKRFEDEITAFETKKIRFSSAKLKAVGRIWKVNWRNLDLLIWDCVKNQANRGKYSMGPSSSEVSLKYFSNCLIELARELLAVDGTENESSMISKISEFLGELYSEVNSPEGKK